MNVPRKHLVLLLLAVMLCMHPVSAFAGSQDGMTPYDYYKNSEDAYEAGYYVAAAFEIILNKYVGSDVDIESLFNAAMRGISEELDDYSKYMSIEEFGDFISDLEPNVMAFGIYVFKNDDGYIEISGVLPDGAADKKGLMEGDVIFKVNGEETTGMSASESVALMNQHVEVSGTTNLEILRAGESGVMAVEIAPEAVKNTTVGVYKFEDMFEFASEEENANLRYMYISSVGEETHNEVADAIAAMQAEGVTKIVLDLRDNTGGYLDTAVEVCRQMVPEGAILYKTDKSGVMTVINSELESSPFSEILVLINGNTASAAEVIGAALQDSGATLIGSASFGKGVIQSAFSIHEDALLKLTTGEYYRRSGANINGIGITPDIIIDVPDYIGIGAETEELSHIKQVLGYLGYDVGPDDDTYDEITKKSVVAFKTDMEVEHSNDELDKETLMLLNEAMFYLNSVTDIVLEAAYEMLLGK